MKNRSSIFAVALLLATGFEAPEAPQRLRAEIVRTLPHDPAAFTQGLFFHDGALFESTGIVGRSSLRRVDLETGRIEKKVALPSHVFGEGATMIGDRIATLTWRSSVGYVFDAKTLKKVDAFDYEGEGWGIAADGDFVVMSDGSSELRVLDKATLTETRRIRVTLRGEPLQWLNELEFVDGRLFANVWQTDFIVRIDQKTGAVDAVVDATGLREALGDDAQSVDVLNGIAWDEATGRIYVTGKYWPKLFEIRLTPEG
jgi:glutaminyl-peptide cyclotransferase